MFVVQREHHQSYLWHHHQNESIQRWSSSHEHLPLLISFYLFHFPFTLSCYFTFICMNKYHSMFASVSFTMQDRQTYSVQDGTKCRSTVSHGGTVPHYSLVSWVNILPKNPYLFLAGFLGNSYFAEEQKGRFSGKLAKLLKSGVKC